MLRGYVAHWRIDEKRTEFATSLLVSEMYFEHCRGPAENSDSLTHSFRARFFGATVIPVRIPVHRLIDIISI